jgi:2-polyprenyl-6-methoxyphenol hydroxylase-like FAD-dependent oxidoreductase
MGSPDADVIVVGGGLGGAAIALGLARRGISVAVVDKADFPRDKPCGEGLLPHGLELLDRLGCGDLVSLCGGQPFVGILYHCHGVVARGDFEGGARGRGIRRRHLDAAMRARAASAGATLVHAGAIDVATDSDGVTVTLDNETTLRGRLLVGADGPRSMVRHRLGLDGGPPRTPRFALRQHFRLNPGSPMPERVEVHVAGGHELYVTPVENDVVGIAALVEKPLMTGAVGPPDARLMSLIQGCEPLRQRLLGAEPIDKALACGPLRVKSKAVWQGRAVLIGDAAGYVDAITGEGMSLALKTAALAEDAIARILATDGSAVDVDTAFGAYASARGSAFRDHAILTHGLVTLARHPYFARRAIARLARDPTLFTRLLAVNNGTRTLLSLGLVNALKLAVGSTPPRLALGQA